MFLNIKDSDNYAMKFPNGLSSQYFKSDDITILIYSTYENGGWDNDVVVINFDDDQPTSINFDIYMVITLFRVITRAIPL